MPMYEYRCEKCESVIETMQKFSDAPLADCEKCGGLGTLSKLISKSSFALKGTGWYTTDYKRSSAPVAQANESVSPVTAAASGDGKPKTEAAPAVTPAPTPAAAPSPSKSKKGD